jgi:hypothetical protein
MGSGGKGEYGMEKRKWREERYGKEREGKWDRELETTHTCTTPPILGSCINPCRYVII